MSVKVASFVQNSINHPVFPSFLKTGIKGLEEIFMPSFYPPSISPFTLFPTGSYYFGHSKAEKLPIGDSSARNLPMEFPPWKFTYRIFHIQDICLRNFPRRFDWSFPRRTLPHHFRWRFPRRNFPTHFIGKFPTREQC